MERDRVFEVTPDHRFQLRERLLIDIRRSDVPPVKGAATLFKPPADPCGNAFGRKLFDNAIRLLVGVSLDIAAMRSNDDQSSVAAVVSQAFDELAVVGRICDLRINLAPECVCAGQPKAVSQIMFFRLRIPESKEDYIRLLIVQIAYCIERIILQRYPVWRIPFYANLLTFISPYSGDLSMVR